MNFKVGSARLLVSTFGDRFPPNQTVTPDVMASHLDDSGKLEQGIREIQEEFEGDYTSAKQALNAVHAELAAKLTALLNTQIDPIPDVPSYKVIYDSSGNPIGHDTISWIFKNGTTPIEKTVNTEAGKLIGMFACVYLSVVQS